MSGSWIHADEVSSFFELKAYVLNIFQRIGLPMGSLIFKDSDNNIFSQAMTIENRNGAVLAELGVVSKAQLKKAGVEQEVYFADLHWTQLAKAVRKQHVSYREISRFPAVSRDLALLLDVAVPFAEIERIAFQSEKKLLKKVELFDVYEGKNLPAGKKSYAVNFVLQDEQRTLDDRGIDAIMNKIIANLKKQLNAELR